jgi:hypothetical protein
MHPPGIGPGRLPGWFRRDLFLEQHQCEQPPPGSRWGRNTKAEADVRKGRHRRFEEARALKRLSDTPVLLGDPCDECGALPNEPCASWCLGRVEDAVDDADQPGAADREAGGAYDAYGDDRTARPA